MEKYFTDATYENIDYTGLPLALGEYEGCIFHNCNFSNSNLGKVSFIDCVFSHCNISNARLAEAIIRDVQFNHCKMMGLHFETCSDFLFSASFTQCTLNLSSFYKLKIKNTVFNDCILHEIDFTDTDLTGASFTNCDLKGATFDNTLLEKADLSTAYNYIIDPDRNKIKKARFSKEGLPGLLMKYNIVVR